MESLRIIHDTVPTFVQIETSYACNVSCSFCYNPVSKQKKLEYDKLRQTVESVARSKVPIVQLTGGEVSLLPLDYLNSLIDCLSENASVSIQTNGYRYLENLTPNLASVYVSLHGTKEFHERLQARSNWDTITTNIKRYLDAGFEVNCDFTLTSWNYSNFEEIARLAHSWGVRQYSINKVQRAGYGVDTFAELVPSQEQVESVVGQMIRLRETTNLRVGFCTAIPYCLDKRLIEYGFAGSCGAGVSLVSINPDGNVRICNQSDNSYGNVRDDDLIQIHNAKSIEEFRSGKWVAKPCDTCFLFSECLGGCKVDQGMRDSYCVDYAVREFPKCPVTEEEYKDLLQKQANHSPRYLQAPDVTLNDLISLKKFTKVRQVSGIRYLITRHQAIQVDQETFDLVARLPRTNTMSTEQIVQDTMTEEITEGDVLELLRELVVVGAIEIVQCQN